MADTHVLRRRSPNPNSPIPYSPALLSPYLNIHLDEPSTYLDPYLAPGGRNPTIRLVPSSARDSLQDEYHYDSSSYAPPTSRSRSDDRYGHSHSPSPAIAPLRRHGTDPLNGSFSTTQRLSTTQRVVAGGGGAGGAGGGGGGGAGWVNRFLFTREEKDHSHSHSFPTGTLPLNVPRSNWRNPSIRSRDTESVDSSPLSTPGNRTGSRSVRSFRNPESPLTLQSRVPQDDYQSRPSSPTPTEKSIQSDWSRSSTTTVPVPFYHRTFSRSDANIDDLKSDLNNKSFERIKSTGTSDRITDKFPVNGRLSTSRGKDGWTLEKFVLLFSVLSVFGYGLAGLIWSMLILLRINDDTDVTIVTDPDIVIFLTLASLLCIFSALVGLTGTLLNSRPILSFYNLLLWPTLLSMCLVGYTSYKRGNLQLDRKLNQMWSQILTDQERLRIQNSLKCCGYYNPLHDATYSKKCYPRTTLPGCKGKWYRFEVSHLHDFATAAFSTIPFHLLNIVVALLCSNQVNRTFGEGLTPPQYRLKMSDVRANALAALNALPPASKTSLAIKPRNDGKRSQGSMESGRSRGSRDSLTEVYEVVGRGGGWKEGLIDAGPRGRALREARARGML